MLKVAVPGLAALLMVLAGGADASAQCVTLSPTLRCSKISISKPLVPAPVVDDKRQMAIVAPPADPATDSVPTDCGIAREVNPSYRSDMPKIVPGHSRVRSVIRTMPTPVCKG